MSLRHRLGALVYDWPRFLRHLAGNWTRIRNRNERLAVDERGARCEWLYTSDLHVAKVYPSAGRLLMRRTFRQWPIAEREAPLSVSDAPAVSFIIGHRGLARLPNLLATLRSIAGQRDVAIECIVIEQSAEREIEQALPPWVRYLHTPVAPAFDYCRAATFNVAARIARGSVLIAHDNDMLVPERYAAEIYARVTEGAQFIDPKRFVFYLDERERLTNVVQNLKGGSIAAMKEAYFAIGGFDEDFVGWGGEDLEFWERAREHGRVYEYGWLPLLHRWHAPQPGKLQQETAPAQVRYHEVKAIPAAERIARLRSANFPNEK
ncbi:MAG TPA: galactosyltransferase-related protein [Thermoanaerobaculia bacterium]|nr:galactosyltransferase-related protein [Thermoanaerobaculia bacterium]